MIRADDIETIIDTLTKQLLQWSQDRAHRQHRTASEQSLRAYETEDRCAAEAARVIASLQPVHAALDAEERARNEAWQKTCAERP